MKKKVKIFILLSILLFGSLFVVYFWFFQIPVETKIVKMHAVVNNYTGFNTDTDAIYFGTIPGKGIAERNFNLTNSGNENLVVNLYVEGNISQFVSFPDNNFKIKANSVESVKAILNIPDGTELGEYSGTLYITFRRSI